MTELEKNLRSIKAEKDSKLIPDNIRAGVKIFDVEGTVEVMDSSDATATANNILSGKTAYIKGGKVSGTMTNVGAITVKPKPSSASSTYPYGYVSAITMPSIATSINDNTNPGFTKTIATGRNTKGSITASVEARVKCKVMAAIVSTFVPSIDEEVWSYKTHYTLTPTGGNGAQYLYLYEKVAESSTESLTISQDSDKILLITLMAFDTVEDLDIIGSNNNDMAKYISVEVNKALEPNDIIIVQAYRTINDISLEGVQYTEVSTAISGLNPQLGVFRINSSADANKAKVKFDTSTEFSYSVLRFKDSFRAANIRAGVKIMDIIGTLVEDSGSDIKQFASEAEMNASTGNIYGQYAVVVTDEVFIGFYMYDGGKWQKQSVSIDDATATVNDIASGKTAYINGGKVYGTLTEIKGANSDTVTASDVSVGGSYVYVNTKPAGRGANEKDKIYRTGSSLKATVPAAAVAASAGLTPDDLKRNVTVLGVTGTYDGLDTFDATATSGDIIAGKSAYAKGQRIIGTIATLGNIDEAAADNITIGEDFSVCFGSNITERGILDKDITYNIKATQKQMINKLGLTGDKIKEGNTILGVEGTAEVLNTDDANATAADLIKNKTAYVKGKKITGTIPSNGALNYAPSDVEQIIPAGYTTGGKIAAMDFESIQDYKDCITMADNVIYGSDLTRYQKLQYVNFVNIDAPIDTNYALFTNTNWTIEMKVRFSTLKDFMSLISVSPDSTSELQETFVNSVGSFAVNLTGASSAGVVESCFASGGTYTIKHVCSGNTYITYINDVEVLTQTLSAGYTLSTLKFGYRGGSNFNGYLYYLKFYSNGNLVFDGIPSQDRETSVVGLYDKSSISFITPSGSIALQAGPKA